MKCKEKQDMNLKIVPVGVLDTNCYLVVCHNTLYIIDPGAEAENIVAETGELEFERVRVLLTHGHIDHISALPDLITMIPVEAIYLSSDEEKLYRSPANQIQPWMPAVKNLPDTVTTVWKEDFEVLPTPGHTEGGVCFLFESLKMLFCGDTLFAGSIGRTDLPGGSHSRLLRSIQERLWSLADELQCFPGHGSPTTIGREKRTNPFV